MTVAGRRFGAALGASALLHAAALAVLLRAVVAPLEPPRIVLPVALIGPRGGGGGASGPPPASEPAASEVAPADVPPPAPVPHPSRPRVARSAPPRSPRPPAPARVEGEGGGTGSGGGSGGGGSGAGDGSGGDGPGGTAVAYDANPLPPYPLVARRLGKEGVVLLDVLVGTDGRPADVRVLQSSGFAPLDESAATTVRERWRFVPARRGGTAVAVRVTVPIRFRLQSAQG